MIQYSDFQGLKQCIISKEVIAYTEAVLRENGNFSPPNEGFLYWGGIKEDRISLIDTVIAPKVESWQLRVTTSHYSNVQVVRSLSKFKKVQIAQVHSHPSTWVDHSEGDDEFAPFKINGLFSLVVPSYGFHGMLPLTICGVHWYWGSFKRLPNGMINNIFELSDNLSATIIDLRK